jgi:hypothetical protein
MLLSTHAAALKPNRHRKITHPVSMPVSLAVGEVRTPEFVVDLNWIYLIKIEVKKKLLNDELNCLNFYLDPNDSDHCDRESPIQASWTLWSDDKVVCRGVSKKDRNFMESVDQVEYPIGSFKAESGKKYVLEVHFTRDGTRLSVADPHLDVEVANSYYEETMWKHFLLTR